MSVPYGRELADQYDEVAGEAEGEVSALQALVGELTTTHVAAEQECAAAARALATVFLPRLEAACLDDAERRTGFRGFARMNPLIAMDRERQRLERELVRVRADESYVRREYLVGPNGSITRRLAEANEMLDPWERECRRFEDLPGFDELVRTKFDTDHFEKRWWQPAYWRLWAAGDAVCKALDLPDFGDDVLPAWEKVRAPRDEWRGQVAAVEAERDAVLALVKRHDDDTWRLAHLAEIYLEESVAALGEHVSRADAALLEQWADGDRAVVLAVRRLAGATAKVTHLGGLRSGVDGWSQTLSQRAREYRLKAVKYRTGKRPYRTYPAADFAKPYVTLRKSAERRAKVRENGRRLAKYDRYERFDVSDNPPELWWREMTGAAPPVWMPGLRDWYVGHQIAIVLDDRDEPHAGAIGDSLASLRSDDRGDLS